MSPGPAYRTDETLAARWGRRALTFPGFMLAASIAIALLPVVLPLAVLVDVVRRRGPLAVTRTALFFGGYLACESLGIVACFFVWILSGRWLGVGEGGFYRANVAFQRIWGHCIFEVARRVFGMRFVVEGEAPRPGGRPLIVFIRHVSAADTALPVELCSWRWGFHVRLVMKRELLVDPCLDIPGNRMPHVFVQRGGQASGETARLVALAEGMGPGEALVIFPEGTRFTPKKRAQGLARLRAKGPSGALALAESLSSTLSPLRQGPLALLAQNPGADLCVVAHRGLEGAGTFADLVDGGLCGREVRIRIAHLRFEELPRDAEGQARLLTTLWRDVDAFARGEG